MSDPDPRADKVVDALTLRVIGDGTDQAGIATGHGDVDFCHPGGVKCLYRLDLQASFDTVPDGHDRPQRENGQADGGGDDRDPSTYRLALRIAVVALNGRTRWVVCRLCVNRVPVPRCSWAAVRVGLDPTDQMVDVRNESGFVVIGQELRLFGPGRDAW